MKRIVFFDFFGVISSEVSPIWFRKHYDDKTADRVKHAIASLADIGAISEEETYQRISDMLGVPPAQIAREWDELTVIRTELLDTIRAIRQRYPVYLLSNAIASHLRRILSTYDLEPLFDRIFISSEMEIIKPDRAYFEHVVTVLGIDPAEAVMIDDNPANLKGAAEAGIDGILFTDLPSFLAEFKRYFDTEDLAL